MENVHTGHRKRMKAKYTLHGADIFDTHELLEMLLYTVIPYRDTNPVAHELLSRFGSLDGIADADTAVLAEVSGIGRRAAEFLGAALSLGEDMFFPAEDGGRETLGYRRAEDYLLSFLSDTRTYRTLMLSLDNRMRVLAADTVSDEDFGRGRADVKDFVSLAITRRASAAILAHTHPYGPLYPSENDYMRNTLVKEALALSSVPLLGHYILSGGKCILLSGRESGGSDAREVLVGAPSPSSASARDRENLARLFSAMPGHEDPAREAEAVLCDGGTLRTLATLPTEELTRRLPGKEKDALCLKLVASLASRRHTDRFPFGSVVTERQVTDYLCALLAPLAEESVYLLLFDADGRVLSSECVSRGSVNSSAVTPRRLMDVACRRGAASVVLAHNHPNGYSKPSAEDIALTAVMRSAFASVGVTLREHYVIAADRFSRLGDEMGATEKREFRFASPAAFESEILDFCK